MPAIEGMAASSMTPDAAAAPQRRKTVDLARLEAMKRHDASRATISSRSSIK
jgi:hypothetical protein